MTSIGSSAFNGCTNLKSINIPNGVTTIGENAFRSSGLTTITLSKSLTSIGSQAFDGCNSLISVTVKTGTPLSINYITFNNRTNATLYVPLGSKTAYEEADYWKEFKEIIEVDSRREQTLALTELPAMTWGDADYELPASTAEGNALAWESSDASVAAISNGTVSPQKAGTVTITATQTGMEDYKPFTREYTLNIAKAPLTITAEDAQMMLGEDIPEFCLTYEGFVYDDDAFALTEQAVITTTATAASPVGSYPITVNGASSDKYNITYVNGTLIVTASQTLSMTELPTMKWGDDDYDLPATTSEGQELTWSSSDETIAMIEGNTLTVKKAGTVTITATQEGSGHYQPFAKEYVLTVKKAPLTITATNFTRQMGKENPVLTVSYDGFMNGDNEFSLNIQPTITTTATKDSPVGEYPISVTGAESEKYEISYVSGILTVIDRLSQYNTLSSEDIGGLKGTSVVLPVWLTNEEDITALQFDLTLPEGVSVSTNEKGKLQVSKTNRCEDHTLSASKQSEGNIYRVLLYSVDVESITGNSGAVVNLTLDIDEGMEAGEYEIGISNINLTATDQTKITPADATCTLTVRDYITGDANGDGTVDVTDIVAIANHILGQGIHAINTYAADVNGDEVIDVTDIVAVANLILNGNSVKARQLVSELMPQ